MSSLLESAHAPIPDRQEPSVQYRTSNSEVGTFLTCKRKYLYEYDLNLTPIKQSEALNRGNIAHEVLAVYYKAMQDGVVHDDAVEAARKRLGMMLAEGKADLEMATDVDRILLGYWRYYGDESAKYEILAVEQAYDIPLTDESTYVLRLDLLLRNKVTNEVELWDHKVIYDFWSQDKLNLSGQFPKYVGALRFNGVSVDKCVLNQLRYRKMKTPSPTDLYRRTEQLPSNAKIKRALYEQVTATQEILAWRQHDLDDRNKRATRVLNPRVCDLCNYKNLCQSEFDGGDIKFLVKTEFKQKSDYGYNREEVEL